jgi:phenylalanine-4-hydroxylase
MIVGVLQNVLCSCQACRGERIPDLDYLPEERATWAAALSELQQIIPKYGCREFVDAFNRIGFRTDSVPQLQAMHELLQAHTGWSVRPVAGLMHPRDFLNGLAFKCAI